MNLKEKLEKSFNEKDVENLYRSELLKIDKSQITSPYGVDGVFVSKNARTLLEFKYSKDLKNKLSQCNILVQCLYYLKKFENSGDKLPSTILVGDINECFIIHTNTIFKYLSYELDWKISPSEAYKRNNELIREMVEDENILPFVYDVNDSFNIRNVVDKLNDLSNNIVRKVRITHHNLVSIFNYFDKYVLEGKNSLTTNEKANLFIQLIISPNDNFLHPKIKNTLITKSFGKISVNHNLFNSFFAHFDGDHYSIKEKEMLTSIVDRIIEDETRRRKGEFFTPTIWVDEAHKMISEVFGENWKEEYIVWDPAWGTGNLTRDYQFKELYCSTLEYSDIETANQMGYNPEAVKFQYDFLNDGIVDGKIDIENDKKLPNGLKRALLEGKQIIVLMNPPYAKATTKVTGDSSGVAKNHINNIMISENLGIASSTTYAQFLYRIYLYNNIYNMTICIFSKPTFLSGSSFDNFREIFLKKFNYEKGMLFQASEFDSVSTNWGINFTIWNSGLNTDKNNFIHVVKKSDSFGNILDLSNKIIYNTDGLNAANKWGFDRSNNNMEFPNLKSALNVNSKSSNKTINGFIGSINNHSNNQMQQQVIYITSGCVSANGHKVITVNNLLNTSSLFVARKIIPANWINDKDEYMSPNESHPDYGQFQYDSLVYSLFNNSSQQSSLRQIQYKERLWDIKNEFFWMSKNDMMKLAEDNFNDDLYRDAKLSNERYVYTLLFKEGGIYNKLSPDAKEVLDMATDLVKKSFQMRNIVDENHPEYHLKSWDAGYAQLKLVWKDYFKDEFKEFKDKYKLFEDRLRPLVYELGFLKK